MKILIAWFIHGFQSLVYRHYKLLKKNFKKVLSAFSFEFQNKFFGMGQKDNKVIEDLRDSFPQLSSNSKTFEIFNVGVIAGNVPIRHVYDIFQKHKALPYRSCHLGAAWQAIDRNYHIGVGVFHFSENNVLKNGANVLLFDFNSVPCKTEDGWIGDTSWWPGYIFEKGKYKRMDLYYVNPVSHKLEPAPKNKTLLHSYLFLKDGTPLNYYHFQKIKTQGMIHAYTFNKLFSENRTLIRLNVIRLVRKLIRSSKEVTMKEVSGRVLYPTGEVKRVTFKIEDGLIIYNQYSWDVNQFADELSQTMMMPPVLSSFYKRQKLIAKLHRYEINRPVPYPSNELMILLASLAINQKDETRMIHAHSGGYDMAGAKPYTSGYMYPRSSAKMRHLFKALGKASDVINQDQFEFYLFPASIFSCGSFVKRDIPVLNRMISEYIQLTKSLSISRSKSPEVRKIIKRFSSSLSKEFWLNYKPTTHGKLPKMKGEFAHPSLLFELSFSEASYLVGHLRIFGEKMKG